METKAQFLRPLRQVLIERGLTTRQFANEIGLSIGSTRNLICGSFQSRTAKQRATQFLKTQIWKDVPFIREGRLRFSLGDFVVLPTPAMAAEFASELGAAGETIGRHVRIRVPVEMTFTTDGGVSDAGAVMFAHDDGSEGAIEVWSGETPPDSPFPPNDQIISGAAARKARTHTTRKTASKVAAATRAPEKPGARAEENGPGGTGGLEES